MPLIKFLRSTVGLKIIMGLTGAALFAFTVIHMVGNLQLFLGREALNNYAQMLHASDEVIWGFRLGLGAVAILHIVSAIALTIRNRAARGGEAYAEYAAPGASLASRTMAATGMIVAAFIVFHLLHFTVRSVDTSFNDMMEMHKGIERHDTFRMVVTGFQVPWVSAFYILSVAFVSFHLSHGIASFFRSLGLVNPAYRKVQECFGLAFSIIIFVGMAAVPAAVLLGLVKL